MTVLIAVALTMTAFAATAVVMTTRPARQALTLSVYGLVLTILFFLLQAPDVALSQIVIGSAVVPLMAMLTIRKIRSVQRQ